MYFKVTSDEIEEGLLMRVYTVMLFEDPLHVQGRVAEISAEKNSPTQLYYLDVFGDEHIEDEEIYNNPKLGNFAMVSFSFFFCNDLHDSFINQIFI